MQMDVKSMIKCGGLTGATTSSFALPISREFSCNFAGKRIHIYSTQPILSSPIAYLKGVGPQRAELLQKELQIYTFRDLLELYPYRHIDRTKVSTIRSIDPMTDYVQISGKLMSKELMGERKGKRLVCTVRDQTGSIELVWFQGISWVQKMLSVANRQTFAAKHTGTRIPFHRKIKSPGVGWKTTGQTDTNVAFDAWPK
jgi:RecG-like helicase